MKAIFLLLTLMVFSFSAAAAGIKVAPGSDAAAGSSTTSQEITTQVFTGPDALLTAAKRGDTAAQLEIAILYEYGFNMPDKEIYALAWYLVAADGSAKAVKHRDQLMDKLSATDVQQAKKISLTLVTASAKMPRAPETMPAKNAPEMAVPNSSSNPMPEPLPEPIATPESH